MAPAKLNPNLLQELHAQWTPHPGQIRAGSALFQKHKRLIFIQAGRKFGKTELCAYILWRWCNTYPDQSCYYIAPFITQAKEIVWSSNRLQKFGPRKWIKKILNNEMRIIFWNDSFIKLTGADNSEALRGINPHLAVYDEYKDFDPQFHQGFYPNLLTNRAPLIVIGTPPANDVTPAEQNYLSLAEEARIRDNGFFLQAPSWERDNDPNFLYDLEQTKKVLVARGEEDVWFREFGAQFVRGGSKSIFPMFSRERHVLPYSVMMAEIDKDREAWEWWVIADPASGSVFAVTFIALNRYVPKVFWMDEIYASALSDTSTGAIHPRIVEKAMELHPFLGEWNAVYDEAALWFANEVPKDFAWMPTRKALMRQESLDAKPYISTLKDMFLMDVLTLSDRCVNAAREFQSYQKDKNGKIPKANDHCIDTGRYFVHSSNFSLEGVERPENRVLLAPRTSIINDVMGVSYSGEWDYDFNLV